MKQPDLSRYSREDLDRMLYSYRSLARTHLEAGHYALAKWATRMTTNVTIELGVRDRQDEAAKDAQLQLEGAALSRLTPDGWRPLPTPSSDSVA